MLQTTEGIGGLSYPVFLINKRIFPVNLCKVTDGFTGDIIVNHCYCTILRKCIVYKGHGSSIQRGNVGIAPGHIIGHRHRKCTGIRLIPFAPMGCFRPVTVVHFTLKQSVGNCSHPVRIGHEDICSRFIPGVIESGPPRGGPIGLIDAADSRRISITVRSEHDPLIGTSIDAGVVHGNLKGLSGIKGITA